MKRSIKVEVEFSSEKPFDVEATAKAWMERSVAGIAMPNESDKGFNCVDVAFTSCETVETQNISIARWFPL